MLIRIVKSLPAPLMDGFDVNAFRVGKVYEVENRIGRYLSPQSTRSFWKNQHRTIESRENHDDRNSTGRH